MSDMATTPFTLVFTDIVGSSAAKRAASLGTDINARDRAYLEGIQTRHLRLVRSAVAEHHGKEVMTIGDSFFLTFVDPVDALRCCAAIQQHLLAHPISTFKGPLRLRIGIHVGTPEFFENSWHGTDVDIAARAQSAASPDQIVVTDAARQAMGDPLGTTFRPLGTFALKGVGDVKLWDADYDQHGLRLPTLRSNAEKSRLRTIASVAIAAILLLVAGLGGWTFWQQRLQTMAAQQAAKPLGPVNAIIVADFENKTGETVFDTTLTQAFTIQLRQSPVLSIVSAEHLRQSMQYLGKSPDDPLTPEIAREIGIREGVKAYLTGSIAKVGDTYLIDANAVNTENGDTIASEEAQAADKDHVLPALDTVATSIRTRLGESLDSIQKLDTPLGQATTPSLEAFRAYALGDVEHFKGNDIPNAEGHYLQALELDPNFAMAWARLGVVYGNRGQTGKAVDCYTRAFQLCKNVSERERLHIEGLYYAFVTGDIQKSIDTLELASRTYPLESDFTVNLGVAQAASGQLEAAIVSYRKSLALSPDSGIANGDYLFSLLQLDKFTEAQNAADEIKKIGLNDTSDTATLYFLHLLTGNSEAMAQDIATVQGRDDEYFMTGSVALGQEFSGRYREADRTWMRAAAQAGGQKAKDTEAGNLLLRLCGRAVAGIAEDAAPTLKTALALDQSKQTLVSAAFAASATNQPDTARPLMQKLADTYPDDTIINHVALPVCRATLDLAARQPQVALQDLDGSEAYDLVSNAPYVKGLAYLELHDGSHAVDAFRSATRYRGAALLGFMQDYGQAQLGLARAYSMEGDLPSARKAYEALFATWRNADADLPQLLAARKEYASLKLQP